MLRSPCYPYSYLLHPASPYSIRNPLSTHLLLACLMDLLARSNGRQYVYIHICMYNRPGDGASEMYCSRVKYAG